MPRAQVNKLYRTFVKGLITEAGYLTYPEDASTDELNTVLHRKGNRTRRLGIDYESGSTAVPLAGYGPSDPTTEYLWKAVDNRSNTNFFVVQVGDILHLFDTTSVPLSNGKKAFTVNLQDFKAPTATTSQVRNTHVQMVAGKGFLFVVQEFIDPFSIEYDAETDTINAIRIRIQVRDFDGVNDGLANDAEPTNLSAEHHYNLKNQGWVTPGTKTTAPDGTTTNDGAYIDPYSGTVDYTPSTDEQIQ